MLVLFGFDVVPCTTLDPTVGYFICVDVNLDRFIFSQGGLDPGLFSLRGSASVEGSVDTPTALYEIIKKISAMNMNYGKESYISVFVFGYKLGDVPS